MITIYPIKIKATPKFLAELIRCSEGSYEDRVHDPESGDFGWGGLESHPHVVAGRYKTQLALNNSNEAMQMFYEICTGTVGTIDPYEPQRSFHKSATKVADAIRATLLSDNGARHLRNADKIFLRSQCPTGY